jgi:hypothetical protein
VTPCDISIVGPLPSRIYSISPVEDLKIDDLIEFVLELLNEKAFLYLISINIKLTTRIIPMTRRIMAFVFIMPFTIT